MQELLGGYASFLPVAWLTDALVVVFSLAFGGHSNFCPKLMTGCVIIDVTWSEGKTKMIVVWFKTVVAKKKQKKTEAGEKDRFKQGNTTDKDTAIKKIII